MASGATITITGGTNMTQVVTGDTIDDTDFNNARTNVNTLLGTPSSPNLGTFTESSTYGYNQGGAGVGAASVGATVLATGASGAFKDLQDDVQALQAFTGQTAQSVIDKAAGDSINASDWNSLMLAIEDVWNNRFVAAGTTLVTDDSSVRTTSWTNSLSFIITYNFANVANCKAFFNMGGSLGFSGSLTGSTNTNGTDMASILTSIGDVMVNYNNTSSGSGTNAGLGFYDLTTTNQTLLTKVGAGSYTGNQVQIVARVNSVSAPTQVRFVATLTDASDGVVDSPIDGTLTLNARTDTPDASGSGFTIPTISNSGSTAGSITGS